MPVTGQVKNKALSTPTTTCGRTRKTPPKPGENPPPGDTPPDASNEVVSKYGDVVIKKINADKQPLAGAEFAVFRATKESDAAGYTCKNVDFSKEPIAKTHTAASDAGGLTIVRGLQLSNWRNDSSAKSGAITDEKQFYSYCLVETKSPDGYQLLAEPIEFKPPQGRRSDGSFFLRGSEDDRRSEETKQQPSVVVNQPDNLKNKLPLTGGEGIALVSVLGILLVGGGAGLLGIYANRRKDV